MTDPPHRSACRASSATPRPSICGCAGTAGMPPGKRTTPTTPAAAIWIDAHTAGTMVMNSDCCAFACAAAGKCQL